MSKLINRSIRWAQRSQTIDATNHFLHISCHGLDPAAQPVVLGNHPVLLQSEPCERNNKGKYISATAECPMQSRTGAVTRNHFYLCISINNLVFGKPIKGKFIRFLPNYCSRRWWQSRAAACPAVSKECKHPKHLLKREMRTFYCSSKLRLCFKVGIRIGFVCVCVCVCVCVFTSGGPRSWYVQESSTHVNKNRQQRENKDAETLRRHQKLCSEPVLSSSSSSSSSSSGSSSSSSLWPLIQPPWSPPSFHFSSFHLRLQAAVGYH